MKRSVLLTGLALILALAAAAFVARRTPPPKVIVIGLDGLSWTFLDPLLKAHKLPNFEAVLHDAASGSMATFRPTHSGILWTSIATGKTMEKHGITDWTFVDEEAREEIERMRLVTGTRRTAATLWEILSDQGHTVDVTNWWVTYPARPVNGALISDRMKVVINKRTVVDEPDLVYPSSLLPELKPYFLGREGVREALSQFHFPVFTPESSHEMFNTSQASRGLFGALGTYVAQDTMVADWALHLLKKGQPDFFAAVLRIPDVYAHFAWRFADRAILERITPQIGIENLLNDDPAVRQRAQALIAEIDPAVAEAMLPAYKLVDDFVGNVVAAMDPDTTLMIVSDHGLGWAGGGYDHNPSSKGDYPQVSPPGVIIVKGPDVEPVRIIGAKLFDVTPTVLYALREPVALDMDGRALKEVFRQPRFFDKRELRFVHTYGPGSHMGTDRAPSREAEQEVLDDLRTLGYIGSGPPPSLPGPSTSDKSRPPEKR